MRRRFEPPTKEQRAIGARIKRSRRERRVPRNIVAALVGLSPNQLNRVERGDVSIRFKPAWAFCLSLDVNPLWLALGEPHEPSRVVDIDQDAIPNADSRLFLDVIQAIAPDYAKYRRERLAAARSPNVLSNVSDDPAAPRKLALVELLAKRYLIPSMLNPPPSWEELRFVLRRKTESAEAKAALASLLGVSLAAISQWRSGAARPDADNTLRILAWVHGLEVKPRTKKSAGSAVTRPAPKTRKGKNKRNGKSKSDQAKP